MFFSVKHNKRYRKPISASSSSVLCRNLLRYSYFLTLILLVIFFHSCKQELFVTDFKSVTNLALNSDRTFAVDMDSVIVRGIEVPTQRQSADGKIAFSFSVQQGSGSKLYYKIYYQNESYKFPENGEKGMDSLCEENFYGSWGEAEYGFKEISSGKNRVTDFYRIVGNPRNERKFRGKPMDEYQVDDAAVARTISTIRAVPEWIKSVEEKAVANKRPLEQQLELDALYTLSFERDRGKVNHRWKRNPRMGAYSAMLVVCTEEDLERIPEYIQDITLTCNGHYVNPYYWFLYGEGKKLPGTRVILDSLAIRLKSHVDVSKGIFINKADQQNEQVFTHLNDGCNNSPEMFRNAHLEQFFHAENRDYLLNTVPIIADVLQNEYTIDDYLAAEKKFTEKDLVKDFIRSSDCPCKTVYLDKKEGSVGIFNPASKNIGEARKENVGIKTRIGYTYGTFTAKIKFPSQLNSTNVWTGLTNAFWMLFQDKQDWNHRRLSKSGYSLKGTFSPDAPRTPTTYYSEIDFEMVKTSQYWPAAVYPGGKGPEENAQQNSDVMVTTTNWDLSSSDPKRFGKGFCPTKFGSDEFQPFRWEPWYQAITIRNPVSNADLYTPDFYYYQIEWRPTEIIWRIGPSKDRMRVIGYMNDEITMIPNNQMVMIVTQEYHRTDWWPPMPFRQEYVPFLKNDLEGKVYDFEIE